jgi:hypothetical protein
MVGPMSAETPAPYEGHATIVRITDSGVDVLRKVDGPIHSIDNAVGGLRDLAASLADEVGTVEWSLSFRPTSDVDALGNPWPRPPWSSWSGTADPARPSIFRTRPNTDQGA